MARRKLIITINLFIGILSFGSWIFMALLGFDGNALTSNGLGSLKYFTVLSNLFNGAAAIIYACWLIKGREVGRGLRTFKLVAVSSVGLTFVTVMVFLGPLYGYMLMLAGSNLWMHLILPVGSMLSFVTVERGISLPFKNTSYAMIPAALYATGYLINIGINGIGEWPDRNDFYGFLMWGNAVGAAITVAILLIIWGIAVALYKAGGSQEPGRKNRGNR